MPEIDEKLGEIVARVAQDMRPHLGQGRVADYIPALARVDPRRFGIAVVTTDGRAAWAGDAATPFSVQSVSKVFTLTLAMNRLDEDL
jgi:glutaminase